MITLAVAAAFQTLASQLSEFTGGEDGLTFKNPTLFSPSVRAVRGSSRPRDRRQGVRLLPASSSSRCFPGAVAHRQLAVRARAGDPRERLPRRGDRLPHGGLPHLVQRALGAVRDARRRAARGSGCATPGRTRRCRSRSCSTSCSSSSSADGDDVRRDRRRGPSSCSRRTTCRTCSRLAARSRAPVLAQLVSPDRWLLARRPIRAVGLPLSAGSSAGWRIPER